MKDLEPHTGHSLKRRIPDSLGQGATSGVASLWSERGSGGICLFQNDKPEIDETHEEG